MIKIILKRVLKTFLVIFGGLLGYSIIRWTTDLVDYQFLLKPLRKELISVNGALTGMGIVYFTTNRLIDRIILWIGKIQEWVHKASSREIAMGSAGIVFGLVIANLVNITIVRIPYMGILFALMLNFLFAYLGVLFFTKKKDFLEDFSKPNLSKHKEEVVSGKILDTSAIIDGRIVDICKAGFIEGTLIIPEFVLKELRHIADSHDPEKRTRGRRGLEVLNVIQKELDVKVEIFEGKTGADKDEEVDIKLLKVAKSMDGKVITTDYNLNKVAEFQGITVLNINELAGAVRPVALPGEEMIVKVIKEGKEAGQGIGYLDDGTMVVVDEGKRHMGEAIGVQVTHVLQTGTGRMIFAKPKYHIEDVV